MTTLQGKAVETLFAGNSWTFLVLTAALTLGCGRSHEATTSGTVTLDGKPLSSGTVTFHPSKGGAAAYGHIQSDGSYEIRTGSGRGLAAGEYIITVAVLEALPPDPETGEPRAKAITPPRYADVKTSGLRFTVRSGVNRIDLPMSR